MRTRIRTEPLADEERAALRRLVDSSGEAAVAQLLAVSLTSVVRALAGQRLYSRTLANIRSGLPR